MNAPRSLFSLLAPLACTAVLACGDSADDTHTFRYDALTCIDDAGGYRTQTQGGWGAPPNGSNPGAYLAAAVNGASSRFAAEYPTGLTIGCTNTLTLTSPAAVEAFLPSGGPARALTTSLVDPGGAYNNVLAGQLVAATLNADIDGLDPEFGDSELLVRNLEIVDGSFAGHLVGELLIEANRVLGGCSSPWSARTLTTALDRFNTSFHDGTSTTGYLSCPESETPPPVDPQVHVGCTAFVDRVVWGTDSYGAPISTVVDCGSAPGYHSYVPMPAGYDSIECQNGHIDYFFGALAEDTLLYRKDCSGTEVVGVDRAGGPVVMRCPWEGEIDYLRFNFLGQQVPRTAACAPNSVVTPPGGTLLCPDDGELHVSYYGEATWSTSIQPTTIYDGVWVGFSCTPGDELNLTQFNF